MSDEFNQEVKDSYKEHSQHDTQMKGCSACHSRKVLNFIAKDWREELGFDNHSKLHPRDGSSPWSPNPLE